MDSLACKGLDTLVNFPPVYTRETTRILFEPAHDKTYKMACAPSEDSDQPWHPPLSAQGRLRRLGGCPGWSVSLLGTHAIL